MDALKNCVECGSTKLTVKSYVNFNHPEFPFISKVVCNECGESGYFQDPTDEPPRTRLIIE